MLVAGGASANGPLASVEILDDSGASAATAPMSTARAYQVCAPLPGGGVLVAGGTSFGNGVINSAASAFRVSSAYSISLRAPSMREA